MYEQYLPQKEKNFTLEQASLLVQGWQVHSSEGTGRGWVWCVPVWGCRELALCTLLARLILCSSGLWSDLWELQPRGHTSPSWSALLTPCHILVGLRNSLFLFELIRTQKKENGGKKKFSHWDLGKGRRGGMLTWSTGTVLSQAMQPCIATFSGPREASPLGAQL